MKNAIIVLVFLLSWGNLHGQILFSNPGLEDTFHAGSPPVGWDACSSTPDCLDSANAVPIDRLPPFQGSTYLGLQYDITITPTHFESAGQRLNCSLKPKKQHQFTLYAYEASYVSETFLSPGGRVQFWAGFNKCSLDTMLWQSPVLDTVWKQYTATFTPDKPYSYITFVANNINGGHSYLGVDALSDITVDNYNFLSIHNTDTIVNVSDTCFVFAATSDDTTATFQWSSYPESLSDSGKSVTVCHSAGIQYLICTATYGCGMQKSDTVAEIFNGVQQVKGQSYFLVYPNPAGESFTIDYKANTGNSRFILYDMLGKEVGRMQLTNINGQMRYDTKRLPNGLYFWKVTGLNVGGDKEGKVVITQPY